MKRSTRGLILYSGALTQIPRQGGLTWLHLQFLLGFRRLGWDVLFIDRVDESRCVNEWGQPTTFDRSLNLQYFLRVMQQFDLTDSYCIISDTTGETFGLSRRILLELASEAVFLVNVMGYLSDIETLNCIRRRVFLDIDPGFGQMWHELGLHNAFAGHTDFVTLGSNIGRPDCTIPTCGLHWLTMRQPVVLERWSAQPLCNVAAFTTIGAWRGPNGPIDFRGQTYGLRVHEFRKFIELPKRCPNTPFEMALEIHAGDALDRDRLNANGWKILDPVLTVGGPVEYQSFIAASKAEIMIPKAMYVTTNSGLLSDRSVYYLASGKPVLARDTGLGHQYPTGDGLLAFTNLEEAVAGVHEIERDYHHHSSAARRIAEEYFDSDKVLAKLLDDLQIHR